ncbi:MAG: hypothetical protein RR282_00600 [Acinetobacter sp.]
MQEQITQLHLEILALCFAVKAEGHDAFYDYAAHVNWATVRVYLGGWGDDHSEKFDYLWTRPKESDIDIAIERLTECKTYLEGLMG